MKFILFVVSIFSIANNAIGRPQDDPPIAYAPLAPRPPIDPIDDKACGYNDLGSLLQDEGPKIGNQNGYNVGLEECKQKCTDTYDCKSLTWCEIGFTKCHMKGKIVNVDRYEPTKSGTTCKTYYPKSCQRPGQCTCGDSCWTGSTQGVCLEDNKTCGQPFNTPFCPGAKKTCQGFGEKCGFGSSTGYSYGECCNDEQDLHCMENPSTAPGAEKTCRHCEDNLSWTDYKYGDGKDKCINLTLNWCNNGNGEFTQEQLNYAEEARKNCPRACGLC